MWGNASVEGVVGIDLASLSLVVGHILAVARRLNNRHIVIPRILSIVFATAEEGTGGFWGCTSK
jgi:hypothetical protein